MERLENFELRFVDTVERAAWFLAYCPSNVGTGPASSRPLGSDAELPFLPKVFLDLYDATAAVQSTGRAIQPTEDDSPRARSEFVLKDKEI